MGFSTSYVSRKGFKNEVIFIEFQSVLDLGHVLSAVRRVDPRATGRREKMQAWSTGDRVSSDITFIPF